MPQQVDIAIIGASTSGLFAAGLLARSGAKVVVFEQRSSVKPARRTLIITPYLRRILPFSLDDALLHTTSIMAVASPQAEAEIHLREPDLIVERNAFTRLLLHQAQEKGADVLTGLKLVGLEPATGGIELHLKDRHSKNVKRVFAKSVIGADGVFSDTARLAGISPPPYVLILQAEVALPAGWNPQRVQVWFNRKDTRFFYWLIPESSEKGVVGLVTDPHENIRRLLMRFLSRHHLHPLAFQGAYVAMHHPRLRPWGYIGEVPVYLVGDAAGQVKVTTVGGSVTGFRGAKAAVEALLMEQPYAFTVRPLKRELDLHWWVRMALDRLDNRGYDALIRGLTPRLRRFLAERTRDEMQGALWRVVLSTPRLWGVLPYLLWGLRRIPRRPPMSYSDAFEADILVE